MKIGLIIIGDELLSGSTQDCNMLYLGEKLRSLGYKLNACQVIQDEIEVIKKSLAQALKENDITICSGGLGPTIDDRTKAALSAFLGVELEDSPHARKLALEHYQRRSLNWYPELNNYHMIPAGVQAYFNPKGLAPGLLLKKNHQQLLCAPGVPREFQSMVDHFFDSLLENKNNAARNYFTIRTNGIPEEQIFNKKCPNLWQTLSQFGNISSYPRMSGIDIVISDLKMTSTEVEEKLTTLPELEPIRNHVWHLGNGNIQELIIEQAKKHNITISTAESCTGGLMAHLLTEVSGSSQVFFGSVVSYDNSVKKNILGVTQDNLDNFGAVSLEVAQQMASGVRNQMNTTYSVSTSGIAGPLGGSEEKPVGTVAIAIEGPSGLHSKIYQIPPIFDRDEMKKRFASRALISLFKQMKKDLSA